jgi:hypothetical protein
MFEQQPRLSGQPYPAPIPLGERDADFAGERSELLRNRGRGEVQGRGCTGQAATAPKFSQHAEASQINSEGLT